MPFAPRVTVNELLTLLVIVTTICSLPMRIVEPAPAETKVASITLNAVVELLISLVRVVILVP